MPPQPTASDLLQAAVACHQAGQLAEARRLYERLLRREPRDPNALNLLGVVLASTGEITRAIQLMRRALSVFPDFPDALSNLGKALLDSNQPEASRLSLERALRLAPEDPEILNNLGNTLLALGRPEEALDCYRRAATLRPGYAEARTNEGLALLSLGRLAEGWAAYEHRWRLPRVTGTSPPRVPLWTGAQPLEGKRILLHAEQGLGDTLQFCRYAPMVAARGAQVVLEVQPPLVRLMRTLDGQRIEVIAQGDPRPPVDLHCPLMSLPLAFGTELGSIPAEVPYLRTDPAALAGWQARLAPHPTPHVGLVWAGNPRTGDPEANSIDQRRSIKLAAFANLGSGGTFVSLQKGPRAQEARRPPAGLRLIDWTEELTDFADTAAMTAALDLVIGVDTSVVHLAGALAVPVWVLNRHDLCWRWLRHRIDSPWYPTARLFTQRKPGDWEPVLAEIRTALADRPAPNPEQGR
jgi:Flp pilus assembly protein TadD